MHDTLQDPRAYLQRQVALFTGVSCVLVLGLLVADYATPAPGEALVGSTRRASLAALVANAAVWMFTRKGERSATAVRALELVTMAVAAAGYATLPIFPPVAGAGGVMAIFAPTLMAVVVLMRAAIIPSPWWVSTLVALGWGALMTGSAYAGWEGVHLSVPAFPSDVDPRVLPIVLGSFATVAFAFVAGAVSHIVHGLQAQVRSARELGQYTLESKIGEGGMGAVYLARHRMLRRPTAVKLLPPEKAGEKAITRFEREVTQTSRLTHPNTVAIYDFGRTQDGVFYYAMEYLDGLSLQELVERHGPLPAGRAIHILAQVADALVEAHQMGLVHRDIKPDNILLCERGCVADFVKVVDFGLVKEVEASRDAKLSAAESVLGTPLYMAPESLSDPEGVDARADLYALGGVGYFLLAGEPPFTGNVVEVLAHHLHTQPEPLSERMDGIDVDIEQIVLRCLEKGRDARFDAAVHVRDALLACRAAGRWSRADALSWWARHRDAIEVKRMRQPLPDELTIARS